MSAPLIRLGKLDFADIKSSIQNYLSTQTEFTDYNFAGSGLSQLMNLLAYNSHYDALSANFLANEMFLDTAVKRSSVVSRAKELGYTPKSARSATTTLNAVISNILNASQTGALIIPIGSQFTSSIDNYSFTFTTLNTIALNKQIQSGNIIFTGQIPVYEGIITQNTVVYNQSTPNIIIPDIDIDTSTLKVEVWQDGAWVQFSLPQTFLTVNALSNVYLLQEGFNGFEVYFGDGILGFNPASGSNVRLTYIITSGSVGNGALNFTLSSNITDMQSTSLISLSAISMSSGGADIEGVESIRSNAMNPYGSQNRAVTAPDYASLAIDNFQTVSDAIAWDGSENTPPQFGAVCLSIEPAVGDALTPANKIIVSNFLQQKGVGNVKVIFVDPIYLQLIVNSTVTYNLNILSMGTYELQYTVNSAITAFAQSAIQKFNGVIRYSSLIAAIDASDYSITGNETTLQLNNQLNVNTYSSNNFIFSFVNPIISGSVFSDPYYDGVSSNQLYIKDSNGVLNVYYSYNGIDALYLSNVGTVNYVSGDIIIGNVNIASITTSVFSVTATPVSQNIYTSHHTILQLQQSNINVTVVKDILA